jgi:putative membrane protein
MFIDYITLLLVNMGAGLVILAWFFLRGFGSPGAKAWAPAFAMVGLVAFLAGLHMVFAWPITKWGDKNLQWANPAYGETSVMLGVLFLGAALAVARQWSLLPVTIYSLIAGFIGIFLGVRILSLGLSSAPILTGINFILTGLAGPLSLAVTLAPERRALRTAAAAVLHVAAAIWLVIACLGYWAHLDMLSK